MADDAIGYILTQYPGRGLPPERTDFEDKVKAEKAFADAKMVSILWQSRSVSAGLGWIKLKEKDAPPPSAVPPPAAKPVAPGAAATAVGAKPPLPSGATPAASPKPTGAANPVASAPPPAAAAPMPSVPPPPKSENKPE